MWSPLSSFLILFIGTTVTAQNYWYAQFFYHGRECYTNENEWRGYRGADPSSCQIIGDKGNHCEFGNVFQSGRCRRNSTFHASTLYTPTGNTTCTIYSDTTCNSSVGQYNASLIGSCDVLDQQYARAFKCHYEEAVRSFFIDNNPDCHTIRILRPQPVLRTWLRQSMVCSILLWQWIKVRWRYQPLRD